MQEQSGAMNKKHKQGVTNKKQTQGEGGGQTKLNNMGYETHEKGGHKQNAQTAEGEETHEPNYNL